MIQWISQFLLRRFVLCTFLLLTLQCCGSVTQGDSEPYSVAFELPAGEDPALFWYGVQKRVLRVTHDKDAAVEFSWEPGAKKELALHEGDRIEFLGSDGEGRLLIQGEAVVRGEKKATIPLRRVL